MNKIFYFCMKQERQHTMEIGMKVKRIREFRNYSQEYMAEHLVPYLSN